MQTQQTSTFEQEIRASFQKALDHAIPSEQSAAQLVRELYRRLAMQYHPDLNPQDPEATKKMQQVNSAYTWAADRAVRQDKSQKGETKDQSYYDWAAATNENIRKAIEAIINLPGIEIVIRGMWVWVSGDTRSVKDQLKAAGYTYLPKHQQWAFEGIKYQKKHQSYTPIDQIDRMYGKQTVKKAGEREEEEKPRTQQKRQAIGAGRGWR